MVKMKWIVIVGILAPSLAFAPSAGTNPRGKTGPLSATDSSDDFELEQARRALEDLIGSTGELSGMAGAPLMTAAGHNRRINEIKLLGELELSDAALEKLTSLWDEEHGKVARGRLKEADQLIDQQDFQRAERSFKELCDEYGSSWAQPYSRLAHLYFMQGRMEESKQECEKALAIKPWHFVVQNEMCMVSAFLHDMSTMQKWTAQQLPSVSCSGGNNDKRKKWVLEAVDCAKDLLAKEETRLQLAFSATDESWQ